MKRRRLPIGIQNLRNIRTNGSYYVDKTPFVRQLVEAGDHYFLSRPRRFGKSLLLDTIKSLFEGEEELFRGLDIHGHWDWSVRNPVLRLSFDAKYTDPGDLERNILAQLKGAEDDAGLQATSHTTGPERLWDILKRLHKVTGQRVAVLVDEYDKPILDTLHDTDLATANRDYLRGFYGVIKGSAEHVRFTFVTGVSMFSKVSLFSGLNNLKDISLDPRYATICGYTDSDIDEVFAPELEGLDREKIRTWYNGYHWRGGERVYNPYDVLLLFDYREFQPYWFETSTPNFLYETLDKRSISPMELENRVADRSLVSKFDVGDIGVEALLFQTGYLTIAEEMEEDHETFYRLDYPNQEVRMSLNDGLLAHLGKTKQEALSDGRELLALLEANDFAGFAERLRACYAGVPYHWHAKGDLARHEAWFASLLYVCLRTVGADQRPEEASARGRADLVVLSGGQVFVLEFKVVEDQSGAEAALAQMRERGYAEKYRAEGGPVHLVGVACGREERNLLKVRAEPA